MTDLRALVQRLRKPLGARQLGDAFWVSSDRADEIALERRESADAIESLLARAEAVEAECARLERAARAFQASTAEFQNECARLRLDAERYEWAVANAVIETQQWRHDGRDPSSTKHVLDRAIDRAIAEGKHEAGN